jgi:hypothetical protein
MLPCPSYKFNHLLNFPFLKTFKTPKILGSLVISRTEIAISSINSLWWSNWYRFPRQGFNHNHTSIHAKKVAAYLGVNLDRWHGKLGRYHLLIIEPSTTTKQSPGKSSSLGHRWRQKSRNSPMAKYSPVHSAITWRYALPAPYRFKYVP